ncbi:hypothetical protein DFH08DRAFT_977818 [Mycena albidolilacea]|uniref:Uncharacterized protein n=1 Tax=Mycena albidolilacea TaxID=1033008 RepID=A0AAD6Z0E2_9AGAR|nr:hypothetical protein DFH08DRAFT_977818 [Mycena albidolilacea]
MVPPVRASRALLAPPPSISRTRSFLLLVRLSALGGVEHVPADLFEHATRLRCSPPRHSGRASLMSPYSLRRLAAHASTGVR